jgi:hypothetical protein
VTSIANRRAGQIVAQVTCSALPHQEDVPISSASRQTTASRATSYYYRDSGQLHSPDSASRALGRNQPEGSFVPGPLSSPGVSSLHAQELLDAFPGNRAGHADEGTREEGEIVVPSLAA